MGTVYERHPDGSCDIPNCLWCGPKGAMKAMDEPKPVFCSECGYTPHRCEACLGRLVDESADQCTAPSRCVIHSPNRFDPYEALDKLEGGVEDIRNFYPDLDPRCEEISERLNALRAYITGMER